MNTCSVLQVSTLQEGDHICIWDKSRWPFRYAHHGIVYRSGITSDEIQVAHLWSPISNFRESQADSSFRTTSLESFFSGRPLHDMRRVQYNSSIIADACSMLGEVHRSRSDIPPIVLARCNFLLGMGKGHFNILTLNCEHIALWCKTGTIWSKQLFHKVAMKAPFVHSKLLHENVRLLELEDRIKKLRQLAQERYRELTILKGKRVYLQLDKTRFIKRLGKSLYAMRNDPCESDIAFRHQPTAFRLDVHVAAYDCIEISLLDVKTDQFLSSRSGLVRMTSPRQYHRQSLFRFEYGWNGELQSQRNRRWFVGIQTRDGMLRTFNTRDKACSFSIVDANRIDEGSSNIDFSTLRLSDPNGVETDSDCSASVKDHLTSTLPTLSTGRKEVRIPSSSCLM